jgi:hypothetical protein
MKNMHDDSPLGLYKHDREAVNLDVSLWNG